MPVYDQSYRHITGERRLARARWAAIAASGVRLFFRRKRFYLLGLLALAPALMGLLLLILPQQRPELLAEAPPFMKAFFHVSGVSAHVLLTNPFSVILRFLFVMLAGGGLIANDLRANALEIYFSRPITRLDYLLGKLGVLVTILLALWLAPVLVLWLLDLAMASEPGFTQDHLRLLPRLVAAGLVVSVPYALIMLAVSALSASARVAMVFYAGLFLILQPISKALQEGLDDPVWAVVSLNSVIHRLCAEVLSADFALIEGAGVVSPSVPPEHAGLAAWVLGGVMLAAVVVLFRRVRPIEVVAG